jgi:hypothetical protein
VWFDWLGASTGSWSNLNALPQSFAASFIHNSCNFIVAVLRATLALTKKIVLEARNFLKRQRITGGVMTHDDGVKAAFSKRRTSEGK